MELRKLAVLVVLLGVTGGVLYFRFGRQIDAAEQVRREIVAFLPRVNEYDRHKTKLDGWAAAAHDQARSAAYADDEAGPAGFDEDVYAARFFEVLCSQALSAGLPELEQNLRTLAVQYDNELADAARSK